MSPRREETEAPFGEHRRDWSLARRVLAAFAAVLGAVAIYAASSYVKAQASAALEPLADLPPRVKALEVNSASRGEQLKEIVRWQSKVDENQTRLTILLENQQRQIDRQQMLIDRVEARSR